MNSNMKEALINLKERIETSRREEGKKFFKIWITITLISVSFQLLFFSLTGMHRNIRIIPKILGYILGVFVMIIVLYFIKRRTGSIVGIDYFKEYKESILLNKEADAIMDSFDLRYVLIDCGYRDFQKIDSYTNLMNLLNSEEYKEFKNNLVKNNDKNIFILEAKEKSFREKMKDMSIIKDLEEKDLESIY